MVLAQSREWYVRRSSLAMMEGPPNSLIARSAASSTLSPVAASSCHFSTR